MNKNPKFQTKYNKSFRTSPKKKKFSKLRKMITSANSRKSDNSRTPASRSISQRRNNHNIKDWNSPQPTTNQFTLNNKQRPTSSSLKPKKSERKKMKFTERARIRPNTNHGKPDKNSIRNSKQRLKKALNPGSGLLDFMMEGGSLTGFNNYNSKFPYALIQKFDAKNSGSHLTPVLRNAKFSKTITISDLDDMNRMEKMQKWIGKTKKISKKKKEGILGKLGHKAGQSRRVLDRFGSESQTNLSLLNSREGKRIGEVDLFRDLKQRKQLRNGSMKLCEDFRKFVKEERKSLERKGVEFSEIKKKIQEVSDIIRMRTNMSKKSLVDLGGFKRALQRHNTDIQKEQEIKIVKQFLEDKNLRDLNEKEQKWHKTKSKFDSKSRTASVVSLFNTVKK